MDNCVKVAGFAGILHVDGALRMGVAGSKGVQWAEVWGYEYGLEAEAGGLDSSDDVEQIEVGVSTPGV